jgi:hypothetical protein
MILYKYCAPERIDILDSGWIMLTRPRAFNDPFELNPHITTISDPIAYRMYIADRTKQFVVLSLADNRDSLLMWAHYTESHAGFLLGFDAEQEILAGASPHRDFGPVLYSHSKPAQRTFGDVTNSELFYRKSSEWAYEREWRIVDSAFSADGDPVGRTGDCYPFRFRPEALQEVIIGCKCSIYCELQGILREPKYSHVAFISATADREKYKLNFIDFPRSSWDHAMIDATIAMKKPKP